MRDIGWIILALLGVFVLPVVLLYGGAVFLMGGLFAWHTGDWTALLAMAGVSLGGPLIIGLIVWNLFRRPEPALSNSRMRVSSRRIKLPHETYEREHGRPSDDSLTATL